MEISGDLGDSVIEVAILLLGNGSAPGDDGAGGFVLSGSCAAVCGAEQADLTARVFPRRKLRRDAGGGNRALESQVRAAPDD